MLKNLLDNFEKVMAEGPNHCRSRPSMASATYCHPWQQKKRLLFHLLVNKVLIQSRQTIEIWYALPNSQGFANCNIWLPKCPALLTARWTPRSGSGSPMWPRMAKVAALWRPTANKWSKSPSGPQGAFGNGNIGALTRKILTARVVSAAQPGRGTPKSPKKPMTPRVTELLRKAIEWRRQLDAGEVHNKVEIAQREGITRARVSQVMRLLRLAREFQEQILTMPKTIRKPEITERRLRPILSGTGQARHEGPSASMMP